MLTRKQHELLMFIHERLATGGVSPSFEEMKEALGLKSKSGIHRLITALEERGFLRRLPHRARALEILRLPEGADAAAAGMRAPVPVPDRQQGFNPQLIRGTLDEFPDAQAAASPSGPGLMDIEEGEGTSLPLYGRIAAGTPIEALRDVSARVSVPPHLLGSGDYYALEVAGDSMVEAGILDGDTVVIQRAEQADNGSIVVALVDENEVTLKRIRRKGNAVALEPANQAHEIRIFGPDRVQVQGRLVGLIRSY